jgi:hypothetical protein
LRRPGSEFCSASASTTPYIHDFGSILAFTEYNFGMPQIAPPFYADANAPDNQNGNVPLSEFFRLRDQRNFTNISTDKPYTYFENHSQYDPTWAPDGPDAGDSD